MTLYCTKYRKPCTTLSGAALKKLTGYHWPGNVRELQHTLEKAVILSDAGELTPEDFFFKAMPPEYENIFEGTIEDLEKKMIERGLQKNRHNLTAVAEQLGITRQTLYNKIKKYNL
jgi:transcriptional regulator of acetoin/glycerol metabolism